VYWLAVLAIAAGIGWVGRTRRATL